MWKSRPWTQRQTLTLLLPLSSLPVSWWAPSSCPMTVGLLVGSCPSFCCHPRSPGEPTPPLALITAGLLADPLLLLLSSLPVSWWTLSSSCSHHCRSPGGPSPLVLVTAGLLVDPLLLLLSLLPVSWWTLSSSCSHQCRSPGGPSFSCSHHGMSHPVQLARPSCVPQQYPGQSWTSTADASVSDIGSTL
jgi:hypothetical protein